MKASIVIAAHNEGDALGKTIQSCVETIQDLDHEIVLADDASTDGSVEAAARTYPHVRVHRHDRRLGASPTKAMGARHARGDVLVFLDGHTNPVQGAIARLVDDIAKTNGRAIITPSIAALDTRRWKNDETQVGHGYVLNLQTLDCGWQSLSELQAVSVAGRRFFESAALIGCVLAISRELYENLWGFDSHMRFWGVEDLDFGLKCWLMGYRILHDPEAMIGHRFREAFDGYTVPVEHVVVNQIRTARKHFTYGVWAEWLDDCRQRNSDALSDHPEGLWARAWELFNAERASVEQERAYLHARRTRDEFWYAQRFGLSWPALASAGAGPVVFGPSPSPGPTPSPSPSPSPKPTPTPSPSPSPPPSQILVVNMIPKSLSGETHQDSEPNIAVNPANTQQIAGTAFTPDPGPGPHTNSPIYVSTDGGKTWSLNVIVPGAGSVTGATKDITLRFSGTGTRLFASELRGDFAGDRLNILTTSDFTSGTVMGVITQRDNVDQPYVQATTVDSGADKGKQRLYVGSNDFGAAAGKTATLDISLDAAAATPVFLPPIRIESRTTSGQDGPQIRPIFHSSGVVYAAFYGWRSFNGGTNAVTADVVVVRDDNWGKGANPFTALVDPGDSKSGVRVATGVSFTFAAVIGQERTGGDLSIAVDPSDSKTVWVAYADQQASGYTIHIRRSTNSGLNWSADLLSVVQATNPGIAINSAGEVGLLYQQLVTVAGVQRWNTHFRLTKDGVTWQDFVLATAPVFAGTPPFQPTLGDYLHLMTVGKDFYGVFCANNTPDTANFPQGVTYQRNFNPATKTLLANDNTTPVAASIDPFFVKVTRP